MVQASEPNVKPTKLYTLEYIYIKYALSCAWFNCYSGVDAKTTVLMVPACLKSGNPFLMLEE